MWKTFSFFFWTVLFFFAFPVISVFAFESDQITRCTRVYDGDSSVTTFGEIRLVDIESRVEIPRIRVGRKQMIETLISGEALMRAKFLRTRKKSWIPRLVILKLS